MAFVRILNTLLRDKKIGRHVVPIVPDESRTFGMEGMFRQFGIFSQVGQLYQPEDADQLMFYKEDKKGQILQEGINEPGAFSSWIAAGTSYSNHDVPMIPFYIYYSMFGFQRVGDLAWAAGDSRTRGFLLGGTAGRTTLNGEGLQHEDGHSHVLSSTIPNCVSYDPTYALRGRRDRPGRPAPHAGRAGGRLLLPHADERELPAPGDDRGREEGILKGMYLLRPAGAQGGAPRVQLLGSGTILREVLAGADLLAEDFGVAADVWSVTSFTELRREGIDAERWNMLHPDRGGAGALGHVVARRTRRGRWSPRPTTSARSPTASARSSTARTGCSAPTASAAATTGASCGASSRSTATTSRSPRSRSWRIRARSSPRWSSRPSSSTRSTPTARRRSMSDATATDVVEVKVPDIGDFDDVPVIEVHVAPGDTIAPEDPLVTLESDKATMDVPSPLEGVVQELQVGSATACRRAP